MMKFGVLFILALFSVTALADQTGQIYLNPYYPQYTEAAQSAPLLEASLQRDFVQFAERRTRVQTLWLEYMPGDPGLIQNDSFVLRRIMDRASARLLKSDFFRKSSFGKAANEVNKKMETRVEFQDAKNQNHRLDLRFALFQGQVFFQYSGLTKAQLRYDYVHAQTAMIFQHDLSPTSSIGIESTLAGPNQRQMVTLQYVW